MSDKGIVVIPKRAKLGTPTSASTQHAEPNADAGRRAPSSSATCTDARDELERLLESRALRRGRPSSFSSATLVARPRSRSGCCDCSAARGRAACAATTRRRCSSGAAPAQGRRAAKRGSALQREARASSSTSEDWALLESLRSVHRSARARAPLVHAGVDARRAASRSSRPKRCFSMRYLGPHNEPIEKGGTVLWGRVYEGPPHVVFGHNAQPEPQMHAWATGLDTGCGLRRTPDGDGARRGARGSGARSSASRSYFRFVRARRITRHELQRTALSASPR